jgi:predicted ATP-dependent serine protease
MEKRIIEAAKLGFTRIVTPPGGARAGRVPPGVEVREVESVGDALASLIG